MPIVLPEEYRFAHDYCIDLHNRLVQLIVFGHDNGSFLTEFKIQQSDQRDVESDFWKWLEENGKGEILGEVLLKSLFPALLSDFCHFVLEALNSSEKGKLTVAYALLRKPLRENLYYLEWLLAEPENLLNKLYDKPAIERSFSKIGAESTLKSIIRKSIARTTHSEFHNADFLWELRWNKHAEFGFDGMCNKAMHLVTTKTPIDTEVCNFNFIFSDGDSIESQWLHIYTTLPGLLFYAVDVCESLMAMILGDFMDDHNVTACYNLIGMTICIFEKDETPTASEARDIAQDWGFRCPHCKEKLPPDENVFRVLYDNKEARCPLCDKLMDLEKVAQAWLSESDNADEQSAS